MIDISMEAVINPDPEDGSEPIPMQIELITDEMIAKAKLKPVTNPISFVRGSEPTPDGIFSEEIFGSDTASRSRQFAYIDLHQKFFQPYVYEVIKTLDRKIDKVASGKGYWHINGKGELIEIKDPKDSRYDELATGLNWVIENFDRIKFKTSDAITRQDKLRFLKNISDEEKFVSKWIVIPVTYRNFIEKNGRMAVTDIDDIYTKLISYTNGIGNDPFDYMNNQLLYNIQMELVKLRKLGGDLIRGKHGFMHKAMLGKSTDLGVRDVISQMSLNHCERPEDNPVDIFHSGVPLSKCLVLGYNFILKWCLDFFENNFKDKKELIVFKEKDGVRTEDKKIPIKDQTIIYTKSFLDKKIKQYQNTPAIRFDPIMLYTIDGKELPLTFVGSFGSINSRDIDAASISRRNMTWTDLFYMAAMDTISDKYIYSTRFPITSYSSIFPSLCTPLTTIKTIPAIINNRVYPNYPYVELDIDKGDIVTRFIDTLCISDLFLDAIGGDWTTIMVAYSSNTVQEKSGELLTRGVYQMIG